MVTPAVETAIRKGEEFLARTQSRDGSWRSASGWGVYPCAMTSLAGLALLAGGNTPTQGKYAANVRKAVDYILRSSSRTGLISRMEEEQRPMYGHGFGMLFLAEAYGMEEDLERQAAIRRVLTRAVTLTARSQSAQGGWLYSPDDNGDEGSVTVTQIQALRACRNAGIKVPKSVIDRACKYLDICANPDGGISYSYASRGSSRPAITAAAVATWYNAGAYDSPLAAKALEYCKKQLGAQGAHAAFGGHYFYSHLYLAQAMWLSGDANWKEYFPKIRDQLVSTQSAQGSWQGDGVGETYGTAIALIILRLPYQYLPIMQR
jgi:hypothetical protein